MTAGMDLYHALRVALALGATVTKPRRTGEWVFRHPRLTKPCRVDGHRKDAPRHLTVWLRRLGG